MAFAHHNLSILFAFLLITKITADLVDSVCGKTQNPPLCVQTLRADPRTQNADLKGLGLVAIDIATNQAKSGQSLVQSLLNGATDPELKEIYTSCLENYSDSVDSLGKCPDLLRSRDFSVLNAQVSAALDNPGTCDDNFGSFGVAEPPQLKDGSVKLEAFCGIILVIAKLLKG